jgi:hypothetical protein
MVDLSRPREARVMLRVPTTTLRRIALACTAVDLAALSAHALELPNDSPCPGRSGSPSSSSSTAAGARSRPFEVGAVASTWLLAVRAPRRATVTAALCLGLSFAAFFALVQPVNIAFASWTPDTLPSDWARYRVRWALGHLLRFVLAAVALACLARAGRGDPVQGPSGCGGTAPR